MKIAVGQGGIDILTRSTEDSVVMKTHQMYIQFENIGYCFRIWAFGRHDMTYEVFINRKRKQKCFNKWCEPILGVRPDILIPARKASKFGMKALLNGTCVMRTCRSSRCPVPSGELMSMAIEAENAEISTTVPPPGLTQRIPIYAVNGPHSKVKATGHAGQHADGGQRLVSARGQKQRAKWASRKEGPRQGALEVDARVAAELGIGVIAPRHGPAIASQLIQPRLHLKVGGVAIEMNPTSAGGYGSEEGEEDRLVVHVS